MASIAILDVDGTLVDTNYHHAIAWFRAFQRYGVTLPIWRIHRHIGMGGDQLVHALAGEDVEKRCGELIREAEGELYRELIEDLREAGHPVVLASSAKEWEVEHYLDLLDARAIVDAWTTSADVEQTKPEPDLIKAALAKVDGDLGEGDPDAILIGDTVWDVKAAKRAGIETLAVLTGGFSEAELREAGAREVFSSVDELRREGSPRRAPS